MYINTSLVFEYIHTELWDLKPQVPTSSLPLFICPISVLHCFLFFPLCKHLPTVPADQRNGKLHTKPDWARCSTVSLMGLIRLNNISVTEQLRQKPQTKPIGSVSECMHWGSNQKRDVGSVFRGVKFIEIFTNTFLIFSHQWGKHMWC